MILPARRREHTAASAIAHGAVERLLCRTDACEVEKAVDATQQVIAGNVVIEAKIIE